MAETDQEDDEHFNLFRGGGWNIFKGTVRENDWLFAVRKIAGGGWLECDACVERSGTAATQFLKGSVPNAPKRAGGVWWSCGLTSAVWNNRSGDTVHVDTCQSLEK